MPPGGAAPCPEDRLNREREALESRKEMVNQANSDLARHQETLNQR
jgi:hypothetical protein